MSRSRRGSCCKFLLVFLVMACFLGLTPVENALAQSGAHEDGNAVHSAPTRLAQYFYNPYYPYPQVRKKKRKPRRRVRRRAAGYCKPPWIYSRGLRRCICVSEGYSLSDGNCVKTAEICQKNATFSRLEQKCACDEGFVENGGQCIDPKQGVVTYAPAEGSQCLFPRVKSKTGVGCVCAEGYGEQGGRCLRGAVTQKVHRPMAAADALLTDDVAMVQRCLKEVGYLRAPAGDTMGRTAWSAFWFFKQDYRVGRTPKGVHDPAAQHKLFTLCPKVNAELPLSPYKAAKAKPGNTLAGIQGPQQKQLAALAAPGEIKPAPEVVPEKKVYARPEAGCLPGDLHALIVKTYGKRPSLKKCNQTCIAPPVGMSKREISQLETRRGIRWCQACLEIDSQLPLEDILKIEKGANVQICTRPPTRLPRWVSRTDAKRPAYTRIRSLFSGFSKPAAHEKAIAVVIGNGTYMNGLPKHTSASASANALYALLTEHMGYEQENVIDLRDATSKDFERVFGKAEDHKGELWQRLQDAPETNVLVYYAGHGGTLADRSDSYILPVDAVKYREERTGYPMSRLYEHLSQLGAKQVLVMLESSFSRDLSDYLFPPNLPEMQVAALPRVKHKSLTVLSASDGNQKTLDDPGYGIGLFTRYVIEGLAGRADLSPIGNNDGKIDAVELYAYSSHMVRLSARKSFGLLQKPVSSHTRNILLSSIPARGQ